MNFVFFQYRIAARGFTHIIVEKPMKCYKSEMDHFFEKTFLNMKS